MLIKHLVHIMDIFYASFKSHISKYNYFIVLGKYEGAHTEGGTKVQREKKAIIKVNK